VLKILYFSGYEWGNMGRRKARLAYEFARQSEAASLLYVEPPAQASLLDVIRGRFPPTHLGQDRSAHLEAIMGRPRLMEENVWVYTGSQKSIPLTRLQAIRRLRVLQQFNQALYVKGIRRLLKQLPGDELMLWLSYPLQAWALDAFPQRALACYDWTDDWAAFNVLPVGDPQKLIAMNESILQEVDQIFAVSEELTRRAAAANPHTYQAPNATDPKLLEAAGREGPTAEELMELPRPIIGYVGQIADKIDYHLIRAMSQARPNWSFVFVGPVWYTKRDLVKSLTRRPNVHFLGARPYRAVPTYLRGFDVCILPHTRDALTRSMDPIKLYDYLASSKPIVSTEVAGVERFSDVVYVGNGPGEFISALDQAVAEDGELRKRRREYADQNLWPQRATEMWALVRERLAELSIEDQRCPR